MLRHNIITCVKDTTKLGLDLLSEHLESTLLLFELGNVSLKPLFGPLIKGQTRIPTLSSLSQFISSRYCCISCGSSVSKVTGRTTEVRFPARTCNLPFATTSSLGGGGQSDRSVRFIHFHLVARLTKCGAIPPTSLYVFMTCLCKHRDSFIHYFYTTAVGLL
jgi:hypothetical protein